MSLATWWLWRYHAFVEGCGSTIEGIPGTFRVCRQSYIEDGVCSSRLKHAYFTSKSSKPPRPALIGSLRRKVSRTCPGASSGGAGTGSNDEDFPGRVNRVMDSFWSWNWLGSTRKMSEEFRWRREDDEGDWRYSAEWWGTQGGGWGRNKGDIVFEMPTSMGNGVVSVTAHPASPPRTSGRQVLSPIKGASSRDTESLSANHSYEVLRHEWRVLRFNGITRQSVAKVMVLGRSEDAEQVVFLQQPNCIAFEYTKSLISSGLAAVSLAGLDLRLVASGLQKMRILCVGLGGGTLPLFLAHSLPGATVDAVEIDPAVISAAVNTMGFPPCRILKKVGVTTSCPIQGQDSAELKENLWGNLMQRITIYENDGEDFVWERAKEQQVKERYDLVFVDAYDGDDVVPSKFWDRNGHFLSSLSSVLNVDHGTVVVNLHTDSSPPSIAERLSGKFGLGYDPALPQGKRVQDAAIAYRDVLLREGDSWRVYGVPLEAKTSSFHGIAFTVSVSLQGNISLVVSRGASKALRGTVNLLDENTNLDNYFRNALVQEAKNIQTILNVPFDMTKRVSRGFNSL